VIIPVADRHLDYANEVQRELADRGLRVEVDDSQSSMQKKIRENARQKIPYLLIVGDAEAGEDTVNVRRRGEKKQEALSIEEFAKRVLREAAART
jgi:threonyl-tRNA synthetase